MKLKQIYQSIEALQLLMEERLPIKTAYNIARILRKVNGELELFDQQKNSLIKELGEEKDGGFIVKPENIQEFNNKINELLDVEVEDFNKILLSSLGDIKIASKVLISLDWLIEEDQVS
jgi:hypothetical protein